MKQLSGNDRLQMVCEIVSHSLPVGPLMEEEFP